MDTAPSPPSPPSPPPSPGSGRRGLPAEGLHRHETGPRPRIVPAAPHTTLILTLVAAGVLATAVGVTWLARRDGGELRRVLAAESLLRVEQAAKAVEEDLDQISEDLRLAGQLLLDASTDADRKRELGTLLAVVRPYRFAAVYADDGELLLSVEDPRGGPPPMPVSEFQDAMAEVARRAARQPPGRVETSGSLRSSTTGWCRIFGAPLPRVPGHRAAAIAFLVDMEPLFAKELHLLQGPTTRLLLLGVFGWPAPATHPSLQGLVRGWEIAEGLPPAVVDMLRRMRGGGRGTVLLDARAARQMGLEDRQVVAFGPVHIKNGGHWSLALMTSASVLRAQEQAQLLRLGLLAAGVAALLAGAGGFVAYSARRAAGLRERLRQADQLAHLHEKTEKILDNVPAGVMALSAEGRITSLNRALRERVPPGVLGGPLRAAFPAAPEAVLGRVAALVEGARSSGRVRELLGARLPLFGEEGHYSLHAVPLESRLPEARLLLVIEDLSALRSLESQLLRAEKLATVGVLAAGIAHEIGTPLSVVRGRAEYLAAKLGGAHPQAAGARVIVDQIDFVTRTLRQLLDFARARPARIRAVRLEPILAAVSDLFRIEAEHRGLALEAGAEPGLPLLSADPDQLQQVLVNLVMNACDACERGGRVSLRCGEAPRDERADLAERADRAYARLEVRDTGCGIPEEHRNQVFDPFFTTKKRGQGTGLGLTIAAQIVRSHDGQIEIQSEPGRGTRVVILWPAANKEQHGTVSTEAHPHCG